MPPPADLFNPSFPPVFSPYTFDPIKYSEYAALTAGTTTMTTVSTTATTAGILCSPSRSSPGGNTSSNDSPTEEARSAFVPLRINTLPPSTSSTSPPDKSARRSTEGVRNSLKAPSALISQRLSQSERRSPSPTKSSTKTVWRPYSKP